MMADSTDDPQWNIFGVKLKPSAIAESIAASLVIAFAGFILLDLFTAFSNQLGRIMPKPGSATANVIDFTKIAIAVIFAGAFAYHLNRLGLSAANDAGLAALHTRLTAGETAGTWYARAVRSAIEWADRFFGDADMAEESWQPRRLGLKEPAPLWTAASYDKCLLIALIYPVFGIYVMWAVTGDAGDAGAALGLINGEGWAHIGRVLGLFVIISSVILAIKTRAFLRLNESINVVLKMAAGASAGGVIIFILIIAPAVLAFIFVITTKIGSNTLFIGVIAIAIAIILTFEFAFFSGVFCIAVILIFNIALAMILNDINTGIIILSIIFISILIFTMIYISVIIAIKYSKIAIFYSLYSFIILTLCFLLPLASSAIFSWLVLGALIYFLMFLTLINAPFDWLALGITRGLLRKGLEKRGLWPLGLGVVDLLISLFIVALLGIFVLFFTQIFNATAAFGGIEKPIFDPFDALRNIANPETRYQAQYYWLYLMLLTTQIPAILNLGAGFLSVIRTWDFWNKPLLLLMGERQDMNLGIRAALAAVQALQFALGMTAGGLLFYLLFIGFVTVEPFAAGNLIDLLLWIAEANWPARLLGVV
jgi:hypothetical protein